MVKITAQGVECKINPRFEECTTYFIDVKDFGGNPDDIQLTTHSADDVNRVLKACDIAEYRFKEVTRVNGNDASVYIGEPLNEYFKTLTCKKLFYGR